MLHLAKRQPSLGGLRWSAPTRPIRALPDPLVRSRTLGALARVLPGAFAWNVWAPTNQSVE